MTARERILARVREGLAAHPHDDLRRARIEERLRAHARGTVPSRTAGDGRALQALFVSMARAADATVKTVASPSEIPESISGYLRESNLGADIRMGSDEFLAALPWGRAPQLHVSHGPADAETATGLSHAIAAAAETGTLALVSGAENPTSINFLPDTHIVVVRASTICAAYEDVWEVIRRAGATAALPRVVNFVTGPSRTADIEQTLLMGAHGPRRLHVIVVEDA